MSPILCLHGALGNRDTMVSLQETLEVYKALPDARLPATPHPIEKVDPDLVSVLVQRFINE